MPLSALKAPRLLPALALTCCTLSCGTARYGWVRHGTPCTDPVALSTADPTSTTRVPTVEMEPLASVVPLTLSTDPAVKKPMIHPARSPSAVALTSPRQSVIATVDTNYVRLDEGPKGWNATAIISLPAVIAGTVVAISLSSLFLLGVAGVVGFTLALIGARRCRDRERKGKGFAIPALILSTLVLLALALSIAWV